MSDSTPATAAGWELPCDPRRPEPPMDRRFAVGILAFAVFAFGALITIEVGAWLGWWA